MWTYCSERKSSIPKCKSILDGKKELLEEKLQEVQECIDYINSKQQYYDDVLSGKIKYKSNLITVNEEMV
jgi:transcriptional regulator